MKNDTPPQTDTPPAPPAPHVQKPKAPAWYKRVFQALFSEPETQQDLLHLLKEATARHLLDTQQLSMIEGVLNVSQKQVRDIMVPRAQMIVVDAQQPFDTFLPHLIESAHSRFPVVGENKDDVIGILLAKDVLKHLFQHPNAPFNLSPDTLRPAVFVPESKRLDALLRELRSARNHLAIVVDEYGGIAGLVTIEDILEEIVGDIEDEYDPLPQTEIQVHGADYLVNALTHLDTFNAFFKTHYHSDTVDTIGGLVMAALGHLPCIGDTLNLPPLKFVVTQADRRRIKQLQVIR